MARKSFPKKAEETEDVLNCLVSDMCGPHVQVRSIAKARYFAKFIDIKSRYTEVVFIKRKNEFTAKLIE